MVNVVHDLVVQGLIAQRDGQWELRQEIGEIKVPFGLRQFIEQQAVRGRPEDREVLEAASVAGIEFSTATLSAALREEIEAVEKRCEGLVRRGQFLRRRGIAEWPDGTVAAQYGFIHALYQEVLYEQITAGRRVRLHGQIGAREEAGYGAQAREIAAELAVHFERGRDYHRAVQYRHQAAENAFGRSAHQEAINHLTQGLKRLSMLPDSPDRTHQELRLQTMLGASLIATIRIYRSRVGKNLLANLGVIPYPIRSSPL
jgi:predicted ATPase